MSDVINLRDPSSWPPPIREHLERNRGIYAAMNRGRGDARAYDQAIRELESLLDSFELIGRHCTRITREEIADIKLNGLALPNRTILGSRIDRLVERRELSPEIGQRLKAENQAGDANRADKIWFCFCDPHVAGQSGIERFFRSWGGEALYNSHERDPRTGSALRVPGVPCVIEAQVSIASLNRHSFLAMRMVQAALGRDGRFPREMDDYEGYAIRPIGPERILRICEYPRAKFLELTKCQDWVPPLA